MKIKKIQKKVRAMLEKHNYTRDSDVYLCYHIWLHEIGTDLDKVSLGSFLSKWRLDKVTHPSAIMRARRKVQEEHKHTRGATWYKRHKESNRVKKEELDYGN